MLSDLQLVYIVPRNSTQLLNISTTKFQVEREPVYSSGVVPTGHLGTLCHNSFRNRAATLFNCLPKHIGNIVNCANPIMFKRALDNHLCSIEDSPMVPNECNSLNSRSKEKTMADMWRATIADQAE